MCARVRTYVFVCVVCPRVRCFFMSVCVVCVCIVGDCLPADSLFFYLPAAPIYFLLVGRDNLFLFI